MTLALVVAASANNVIGLNGDLPWGRRLKPDLRRFKAITLGHPIIMGRKTWLSLGQPLPGRTNIVVSRTLGGLPAGVQLAQGLDQALALAAVAPGAEEVLVVGGGELYRAALPLVKRVYLTKVLENFEGDTHFGPLDPGQWAAIGRTSGEYDGLAYEFLTLQRSQL